MELNKIGREALDALKAEFGSKATREDLDMAAKAAQDYAELQFAKLQGQDVERDLKIVESTFDSLLSISASRAQKVAFEVAGNVLKKLAGYLVGNIT